MNPRGVVSREAFVVLRRRPADVDDFPRWELVNFATSQKAADALAKKPIDRDGERVEIVAGDIYASGPMEIVQPEIAEERASLFIACGGIPSSKKRGGLRIVEAPKVYSNWDASWLKVWEGDSAGAHSMVKLCVGVDRRRIEDAVCAVVEYVLDRADNDNERRLVKSAIARVRRHVVEWGEGDYRLSLALKRVAEGASSKSAYLLDSARHALDLSLPGRTVIEPAASAVDAAGVVAMATDMQLGELAEIVRRFIPLPVVICARLAADDPFPARENPRSRRR